MNKQKLIIPLFILGFIFSTAGAVSAREAESGGMMGGDSMHDSMEANVKAGIGIKTNDNRIDAKTAGEIETAFKAERTRCDAMTSDTAKKDCYNKIVATLEAKFTNVDDSLFRALMGEKMTQGKAGTNMGMMYDDNDKNKSFSENFSLRFQHVITKLNAIHDRLVKVADRIESRMNKMKENNIDTSASVKLLASAREELRLASVATNDANASYKAESNTSTTIDASNYKTVFAKTLANVKSAKQHLIQAHKYLVQAITTLKPEVKATNSVNIKGNL